MLQWLRTQIPLREESMPKRRVKRHSVTQPSNPSIRLIPLTKGQNAIVDAADFEWLNQWNWQAQWSPDMKSFYAVRAGRIRMNRVILGCTPKEDGDHWNHDTLDNRRVNLRPVSESQNGANRRKRATGSSDYKGVDWYKKCQKWRARITCNGKLRHLGLFVSEKDAARAYDAVALEIFGKFSHLNFSQ
jgi:hypothetical protein